MGKKKRLPRTGLPGYFSGLAQRLDLQARLLTPVVVHSGEMGDNDHMWFAELLRQHLPSRIGVDTGFVVNQESDRGSASFFAQSAGPRNVDPYIGPQSDILLTDVMNNAPFCVEPAFSVCPVEMVLGTIEVTRDLNAKKLREDLDKIARVRRLGAKKSYLQHGSKRRPLGYLVGYTGNVRLKTITEALKDIPDDERPNAILLLDRQLCVRKPYKLEFTAQTSDVLFRFITLVRHHLHKFDTGPVDLRAYLPDEPWGDGDPANGVRDEDENHEASGP